MEKKVSLNGAQRKLLSFLEENKGKNVVLIRSRGGNLTYLTKLLNNF
jgi:hypothetical protein